MSLHAELSADGGAGAAAEEFFRCAEFMAAEQVTHTLRILGDGVELAGPVVVAQVPDRSGLDAVSPYGFPGFGGSVAAKADPAQVDWSRTGLVSLFVRHRLLEVPFSAATERNLVYLADPAQPRKSRPSDRRQVRRNLEAGWSVQTLAGADAGDSELAGFHAAYEQTMRRTEASPRYFFSAEYFRELLGFGDARLVIAREPAGEVVAGALAARSDGLLHYYLSGTADTHLGDSPMKNVVSAICELGAAWELPVHLGGGFRPGDALEEFKRGFGNRTERWHTSEIVCDPVAYERLSEGREAAGFFPAYRD